MSVEYERFTCDDFCYKIECGDGIRNTAETCDDGKIFSGDGCSDSCKLETEEFYRNYKIP